MEYTKPIYTKTLFYNFRDTIGLTKEIGVKNAMQININNIIFNKCEEIIISKIDKLQEKLCIGFCAVNLEEINNFCYYLERLNPLLYEKYVNECNPTNYYSINGELHKLLPENKKIRFICKDGTIIVYIKNTGSFVKMTSSNIFFYGKHRKKHAEFFKRFIEKYRSKFIETRNLIILDKNDFSIEKDSIDGIDESAIIFPEKREIFDYVKTWIDSENYFVDHGINHKLGILLYGDPGTGKTTFAKVLATKYNLDLIKLKLSDLSKLITKNEFWDELEDSVVVLEDIDVLVSKRDNSVTSADRENFQALLQLLDGINSCKRTIFLATTNYIDRLDPALIRDGRFDIKIEMKNFDYDEAVKMCNKFEVDSKVILKNEQFPINPAYLQNKIITLQMKEINEKLKQKAQRIGSNKQRGNNK
jgi:SpoVK/Ycf46/Vps4 family AAA+-type ATPase|nr:MAG TPA: ATPase [Caudoviricetes sp.]